MNEIIDRNELWVTIKTVPTRTFEPLIINVNNQEYLVIDMWRIVHDLYFETDDRETYCIEDYFEFFDNTMALEKSE